jgi:hypothetical protein
MQLVIFVEMAILVQMACNLYSRLLGSYVGYCNFIKIYCEIFIYVPYFILVSK